MLGTKDADLSAQVRQNDSDYHRYFDCPAVVGPDTSLGKMIFPTFSNPDTPNIVLARTVVKEVYNRLDMDIEVRYLPGYRALRKANNGKVDGLLFHVPNLGISYANLIQIKTPVFQSQLVGFSNMPGSACQDVSYQEARIAEKWWNARV